MLPCQEHRSQYCQGCHLDCTYWTSFRKNQESQRQLKKQYLSYYAELCAVRTRQFRKLSPLKW